MLPAINGVPVLSQGIVRRFGRKFVRTILRQEWSREISLGYERAFRRVRAEVVLAEYGTVGAEVLPACRRLGLPLVVYFRGYDATRKSVVEDHLSAYRELFAAAYGIVAVSHSIAGHLIRMGCPADKIVVSPSGVDTERFVGAVPERSDPQFITVGRMVEKKGPHLTLLAFARVLEDVPSARLLMIGEGELMAICRDVARGLSMEGAVTFLGAQSQHVVAPAMQVARALLLHSIVASSGDSEGTPNVILEAGAMGLPVVATRHAGIPDVVIEGETGLLVEERDVAGMVANILRLARDPALAGELGRNAAAHVRKYYTVDQSLDRLTRLLLAAADGDDICRVRAEIEAEFPPPRQVASDALTAQEV
jgi:colanic acid/amylovoran biosynthesis glycosyltransferase